MDRDWKHKAVEAACLPAFAPPWTGLPFLGQDCVLDSTLHTLF